VDKHIAHTEEKHRQYQGFTKNYKERKPKQEPNREDLRTALSDALKKQPPTNNS